MTKILLIASILLICVSLSASNAARYGTGEGLNPDVDTSKSDASGASAATNDNSNFSGVNGPSHSGVNGGQGQTGTYGSHTK